MLFNWYLIMCQGFFSSVVMNGVARSYKIGLFLLLWIYIFRTGASHPPFTHPDALLQCKKRLGQVVRRKRTPKQWMDFGWCTSERQRRAYTKTLGTGQNVFSPVLLILWGSWENAPYCSIPKCVVPAPPRNNKKESPLPEWDLQGSPVAVYRPCVQGGAEEYSLQVAGKKRTGMRMTSTKNPTKVVITT